MRLATIRTAAGHRAVRVDAGAAVETGDADVRALLTTRTGERGRRGRGPVAPARHVDYAPLVPAPEKIICVGLNYRDHVLEMGNELPDYPTVFAKFAPALVGAHDDIVLPKVSDKVDWEAELTVVIGRPVRHATRTQAEEAIAGYTVLNDVSVRDFQMPHQAVPAGQDVRALDPARPVAGHPGRAARGRLGDQHRAGRRDGAAARPPTSSCSRPVDLIVLPVTDRHPQARRRDRHRHPGRGGPRPQAPALPDRRRRPGHRGRRDRGAAQHLSPGEVMRAPQAHRHPGLGG